MKDSAKQTEVNDLISLVESNEWETSSDTWKIVQVLKLYDRLKFTKRFSPPTEEEVELFMALELQHWPSSPSVNQYSANEAKKFVAFYQSKGWMVGKNKMKDWHAAARGWMVRNLAPPPSQQQPMPTRRNTSDDSNLY